MGFIRAIVTATKATESTDWHQRLTLASEFEHSMAGFGLMGAPGSFAERVSLSEVLSARDADRRTSTDRLPLPAQPCGALA